jgi:hypothetical protein
MTQNQATQPQQQDPKTNRPEDQNETNKAGTQKENPRQNQGQNQGHSQGQNPTRKPDEQNRDRDEGNQPKRDQGAHADQGKSSGS